MRHHLETRRVKVVETRRLKVVENKEVKRSRGSWVALVSYWRGCVLQVRVGDSKIRIASEL